MTIEETASNPDELGSVTVRCTNCDLSATLPARFETTPGDGVAVCTITIVDYSPVADWGGDPLRCLECSSGSTTSGGDV